MADHSPPAGRSPLFQPLPIHVYLVGSAFAITLGVLEQKVFKVERPLALRLLDAIASRHPEPSHRGQAVKPRVSSRVGWTTLFDTPDVDDVGNALAVAAGHVDQAAANSGSVGTLLPYLNAELDAPISHLEPQIFLAGPREFSYDSGAFFDASDLPTPTATSTAAHADSEHAWSVWRTMLIMLALVVLGILVVTARNRGQRSDIGLVVRRCVVLGKRVARHLRLFIHRTIATRMTRGSEFIRFVFPMRLAYLLSMLTTPIAPTSARLLRRRQRLLAVLVHQQHHPVARLAKRTL